VENRLKTHEKQAFFILDKRKMYKKQLRNNNALSDEKKTESFPQLGVEKVRKTVGKTGKRW